MALSQSEFHQALIECLVEAEHCKEYIDIIGNKMDAEHIEAWNKISTKYHEFTQSIWDAIPVRIHGLVESRIRQSKKG